MKQLVFITVLLFLFSCQDQSNGDVAVKDESDAPDMYVTKFEHEGYHYILFSFKYMQGGSVILDPDYQYNKDTILYNGYKYIKLN